jgi:thiol-disulfide isomerase/thioredoxin
MSQLSGKILKTRDFAIKGSDVYINKCDGKPGMLLIHAKWCHHCVKFISTFNEIADTIGKDFCCASIESEQLNDKLSNVLKIQGFPTIKFFDQKGKIIGEYNKERNKQTILTEICKVYHHCISKRF